MDRAYCWIQVLLILKESYFGHISLLAAVLYCFFVYTNVRYIYPHLAHVSFFGNNPKKENISYTYPQTWPDDV